MQKRLQNLWQGTRTLDDRVLLAYFLQQDSKDKISVVSWYIGGLWVTTLDTINFFDPINVSATHQMALLVEKHLGHGGSGRSGSIVPFNSDNSGSSSANQQARSFNERAPINTIQPTKATSSGV